MSSRHIANAAPTAQDYWRRLAERSGWKVSTAAQLLGISVRQVERLGQEQLGAAPHDWFHSERMTAASQLLAAGQSVKRVAAQLGYTQPANFSRDFKRHHGRPARSFTPRLIGPPPPALDTSGSSQARE
jgi:AraC-like DNA-binding protein